MWNLSTDRPLRVELTLSTDGHRVELTWNLSTDRHRVELTMEFADGQIFDLTVEFADGQTSRRTHYGIFRRTDNKS